MPTGYTADLYDGKPVTPANFILGCARAFGALIDMRDDPKDAPIPDEFAPSNYHADALAKAEARLTELEHMSVEEMDRNAQQEYEQGLRAYLRRVTERDERRERYEAMLREVRAWTPPTPDHVELRKFMIEQITQSIDWDCSNTFDDRPAQLAPGAWHVKEIEKAQSDVERHRREDAAERERAASRTEWVRALRASLPGASVSA